MTLVRYSLLLSLVVLCQGTLKRYHGIHPQLRSTSPDRLPDNIIPIKYNIQLEINESYWLLGIFTGTVDISFSPNQDLNKITLHSKKLTIVEDTVIIRNRNGSSFETNITISAESSDFLVITSSTTLMNNTAYFLTISFRGQIGTANAEGIYLSTYRDEDGTSKEMVATQFEEMGARTAFPCFDEPGYTAKFDLTLTIPAYLTAISNRPEKDNQLSDDNETRIVSFQQSPVMSPHSVAFIISELNCHIGKDANWGVPTQFCGRNGTESLQTLAIDLAPLALDILENYTTYPYSDFAMQELTQVAVPDVMRGTLDNWGLVTYREEDIYFDGTESSNLDQQMVAKAIAHEMAHQWFGDLVPLNWWSDLFLNEGLATFFEYQVTADIYNSWQMMQQFVVEELQPSLVTDSVSDSLPLSYNSTDPEVLKFRFDDISYSKGTSLVRMLQHFIGTDGFISSWYYYIVDDAVTSASNLWSCFQRAAEELEGSKVLPDTVEKVMSEWTYKAGYPLLNVTLSEDETFVTVTQERFLLSGNNIDNTSWYVPITYATSNDKSFTNTETKIWLNKNLPLKIFLNDSDWILLNNQQVGYYRVNYDDALLNKIKVDLDSDKLKEIDEIARSTLIDDQFNLAKAGKKTFGEVLTFVEFLKNDDSYFSWYSAFTNFDYLFKSTSDQKIREELKQYLLNLMKTFLNSFPFNRDRNGTQIDTLSQVLANTWACNLGEESCLQAASEQFSSFVQNSKINPNLRSIVYCNGLRQSSNAQNDFDFLYAKFNSTTFRPEQLKILKSLGCSSDSGTRRKFLEKALTSEIRMQDAELVFSSVYSSNPEGVDDILSFISDTHFNFIKWFGGYSELISLIEQIAYLLTTQDQIDKLIQLSDNVDDEVKTVIDTVSLIAAENLKVTSKVQDDLREYFKLSINSATTIGYHFASIGLVLIVCIFNYL